MTGSAVSSPKSIGQIALSVEDSLVALSKDAGSAWPERHRYNPESTSSVSYLCMKTNSLNFVTTGAARPSHMPQTPLVTSALPEVAQASLDPISQGVAVRSATLQVKVLKIVLHCTMMNI